MVLLDCWLACWHTALAVMLAWQPLKQVSTRGLMLATDRLATYSSPVMLAAAALNHHVQLAESA